MLLESVVCEMVRTNTNLPHLPFSISTDVSNKGNAKIFPIAVRYFNMYDEEDPITDSLITFQEQWERWKKKFTS